MRIVKWYRLHRASLFIDKPASLFRLFQRRNYGPAANGRIWMFQRKKWTILTRFTFFKVWRMNSSRFIAASVTLCKHLKAFNVPTVYHVNWTRCPCAPCVQLREHRSICKQIRVAPEISVTEWTRNHLGGSHRDFIGDKSSRSVGPSMQLQWLLRSSLAVQTGVKFTLWSDSIEVQLYGTRLSKIWM